MPQVHQQKHSKHRMLCLYFLRKLKPFSLAEELIIPAAAVLAETMMGKTVADKIKTVPLSNDTVSRRTEKMRTDKVEQLVDKLRTGESFSLQLDESVDVSGQTQLVAFARYVCGYQGHSRTHTFLQNTGGENNWRGYFQHC